MPKALSFTHELSFSFFNQYTTLSSCTVDGHQMYSGVSVVGKASTIGIEISPTQCKIWHRFQHHLRITHVWAAHIWKWARYL